MNGRRGFMKCLVGALVASAIEIRLAAAPVIEKLEPLAPASVLTTAILNEFYRKLTEETKKVWVDRHRQEYLRMIP